MTSNMYSKVEFMTPEKAAYWLSTSQGNRDTKKADKAKLINDIMSGAWELTHQGIAIDEDGHLFDGHHRLEAIVDTGVPCEIYVTYNAPKSSKVDRGTMRTDRDAMFMAGAVEKSSTEYYYLTYPVVTFAYGKKFGEPKTAALTPEKRHEIYTKYQDYIEPIVKMIREGGARGKTKGAAVLYAMICAYKAGSDLDGLKKWYRILATGDFYVEGDENKIKIGRSVLLFKNYLESHGGGNNFREKVETTRKAMSSLGHYLAGDVVTKIYGSDVYPDLIDD